MSFPGCMTHCCSPGDTAAAQELAIDHCTYKDNVLLRDHEGPSSFAVSGETQKACPAIDDVVDLEGEVRAYILQHQLDLLEHLERWCQISHQKRVESLSFVSEPAVSIEEVDLQPAPERSSRDHDAPLLGETPAHIETTLTPENPATPDLVSIVPDLTGIIPDGGSTDPETRYDENTDKTAQKDTSSDSGKADDRRSRRPSWNVARVRSHASRVLIASDTAYDYQDNWCAQLVASKRFDHVCACFIFVSSIMVGVEVELRSPTAFLVFDVWQYFSIGVFTMELLTRIRARGKRFLDGRDWQWNLFDCICVGSSYVELTVHLLLAGDGAFLLVARTIRVVRIARIIRVVRFLQQLKVMVYTMLGAMKLLGWMIVLLAVIIYMFAVCFAEAGKNYDGKEAKQMQTYFGSVPRSMLTLFQAISSGVSWGEPLEELQRINPLYTCLFLVYICLVVLTMMNVITGFCCEYAIGSVQMDREYAIQEQLRDKKSWLTKFKTVFSAMDEDCSGSISLSEFLDHFQDEQFQAYLAHLNISVYSAMDLFELLDVDGDVSVSIEEFVQGCFKLKGGAKAIDILKVQKDVNDLHALVKCEFRALQTRSHSAEVAKLD